MTPEARILHDVLKAIGCLPDFRVFRNNVGIADFATGGKVTYGLMKGSSDLIGILAPSGRFVSLEVKDGARRPTTEQAAWLRMVRAMGGFACVVRSVDDATAALDRARAGWTE
jgi:hypothetical protein